MSEKDEQVGPHDRDHRSPDQMTGTVTLTNRLAAELEVGHEFAPAAVNALVPSELRITRIPAIAGEHLEPGQRVVMTAERVVVAAPVGQEIGIVDPWLVRGVRQGVGVWVFLTPGKTLVADRIEYRDVGDPHRRYIPGSGVFF